MVALSAACSFGPPSSGTPTDGGVVPKVGFLGDASLQDEASGMVVVPVTLSAAASERVTVNFSISDGSAQAGADYTGETSGTLTFEPGETEQGISLTIVDDMVDEQSETLALSLSAPTGADLGIDSHTITISANILPRASITQATSMAGENASTVVGVFLDPVSPTPVTIEYSIGGQVSAADYSGATGSFTVPANTANFELPVTITDDMIDEFDEELELTLTGSPDVIITNARTRKHTIGDNDAEPVVGFASSSDSIGEAGTAASVTIELARESGKPIEVVISTTTGTNASLTKDYTYVAQTLSIPPGMTSVTVQINIVSDALDEINETLVTRIDSATNAAEESGTRQHTLTITDDDPEPTVAFACSGTTREPLVAGTSVTIQQKVVLSAPSGKMITVALSPNEGGNNADEGTGQDYILPSTSIVIQPETMEQSFDIQILGDTANDTPEDIVIDFGNITNATEATPIRCIHTIDPPA